MDDEAKEIIKKLGSLNWNTDAHIKDIEDNEFAVKQLQNKINESKKRLDDNLKAVGTLSARLLVLLIPPISEPIVVPEPIIIPEDRSDQIGRE